MFKANSELIMQRLKPDDKVLDIGGWALPFNRANFIMDAEAYETRGYYNRTFARNNPFPPIGGNVECFNAQHWIQRDICDKEPYPFASRELDFVICSHTLEDVRDPLWVCSEMIRIGKAGYIEVPSRVFESCRGHEPGIAGLSHHRWLIDIDGSGSSIQFMQKIHRIHNRQYSLPNSVAKTLTETQKVQWLFWEDTFCYSETTLHGSDQLDELERFVSAIRPYPRLLAQGEYVLRRVLNTLDRAVQKLTKAT